jgi:hypothetical protein
MIPDIWTRSCPDLTREFGYRKVGRDKVGSAVGAIAPDICLRTRIRLGCDTRSKSGLRNVARNLTLDFASFGCTGQLCKVAISSQAHPLRYR